MGEGTGDHRPSASTLHELVAGWAARTPDAIAVRAGEQTLTYRELDRAATERARLLRAHGAGPETLVGVCLHRSVWLPVALLAVLRAGAAYLPLDPAHPVRRLGALLRATRPVAVLAEDATRSAVPADPALPLLLMDDPGELPAPGPAPVVRPENLAYVLYTSGSTGTPRPVGVPHRAVLNLVRTGGPLRFGPDEVFLHAAPLAFDASTFEIWGALAHGATLVLLSGPPAPGPLAALIAREKVSSLWLTAGLFQQLAEDGLLADLGTLRQLVTGGDVVAPHALRLALNQLPHCRISNGYGPTEATTFSTVHPVAHPVDPVPIGHPIPGARVHVLDDRLRPAETGELYLGGAGLARGYLGLAGRTATRFLPDPFSGIPGARMYRTGDRVRRLPDGGLHFLGRRDRQLKLRGFRIEPGEIEAALRAHPGVGEAVVLLRRDRLLAYVTGAAGTDPAGLRHFLAERLPGFMVPAALVVLPRFPLTANGKIDRAALPEPAALPAGREPATPVEHILAASLAPLLDAERVGADDDFFALGLNSLQVMRWLPRIRSALGVEPTVRAVFTARTLATLATQLSDVDTPAPGPARIPGTTPDTALSHAQQQLWLLDQLHPSSTAYLVPLWFDLHGTLEADLLERAFAAVIDRHEPLRTIFPAGSEPRAEVAVSRFRLERIDLSRDPGSLHEVLREQAHRPLDLSTGPPLRACLIHQGPGRHLLTVALHHIVCDGWSTAILLRELSECYRALHAGEAVHLPALPARYHDFVAWQRDQLTGEAEAVAAAYWRRTLAGAETLRLPARQRRSTPDRRRGGSVPLPLPEDLVAGLRELGRAREVTLFTVLLAAVQVLLARYSGQRDICVGVPVAGRERAEFEPLIGHFVNPLVLRGDLRGNPPFGALLTRTAEAALDAYAHRQLPFPRLVELLGVEREAEGNPLFQVALAWQNTPGATLELPGVVAERREPEVTGSTFDLTFAIEDTGTALRASIEYDRELFGTELVRGLATSYRTLLTAVLAAPDTRVAALPVLSTTGHRWLRQSNAAAARPNPAAGPGAPTILSLVGRWIRDTPHAPAVSCAGRVLDYAELDARATRLARTLLAHGAGPERLVGVCLERGPELPVVLLAVLRSGAAYLPLEPGNPPARLEFLLRDARPCLVVCEAATLHRLPADNAVPLLCHDPAAPGDPAGEPTVPPVLPAPPLPPVRPDNLAYVTYTSGSTGAPKAVAVPHRGVVRLITDESAYAMRGEVILQLAPFAFDASTFEIWGALGNGARIAVPPPGQDPLDDLAGLIRAEAATTCMLTTALFHELVHTDPGALRGLRQILVGGEALAASAADRALAALPGSRIVNVYGPTETVTFCSAHPLEPGVPLDDPVPLGGPLAGGPLHVLGDGLGPLPAGARGELYVEGPGVSRGYLGRPGLTAERFVASPFGHGTRMYRTGDLALRREDGVVRFLGRRDGQVKIRGFRVEIGEIEAVLRAHPAVEEAVVTVLGDQPATRRLVASVVATPNAAPHTDFHGYLAARLPGFLVPSRVSTVDSLPRTATGKLDRAGVAARELARRAEPEPAGTDSLSGAVAEIWAQVLDCETVGERQNFFDLGGNSLLLTRVRTALRERLGAEVPLVELFRHPTVRALADHLRAITDHPDQPEPPEVPGVPEPSARLTTGRQRMARQRARRSGGTGADTDTETE